MNTYTLLLALLLGIWFFSYTLERSFFAGQRLRTLNYSWLALSWIPGLVLLSLPIYIFPEQVAFIDVIYIAGLHLAFVLGSGLAMVLTGGLKTRVARDVPYTTLIIIGLLMAGIFGQVLNGADSLISGKMNFSDRLSVQNLADAKASYQAYDQSKTVLGPLAGVIRYLIGFGQIGIIAQSFNTAAYVTSRKKIASLLMLVLIVISCFNSWFITAGRLGIIITLLYWFVPRTVGRALLRGESAPARRSIRKWLYTLGFIFVSAFGIYYLSTVFLVGRLGKTDAVQALSLVHRASLNPELPVAIQDDPAMQVILFQASYLTNPIPTAVFYIHKSPEQLPGPRGGAINFALELALARQLTGNSDPNAGVMNQFDIEWPLVEAGYYGGVWSSMVREVLVDFGHTGAFVFFGVFGFVGGWTQKSLTRRPTTAKAVFFTFLRVQMVWSGFHSLLYHQLFSYGFLLSFVFLIWSALIMRRGREPELQTGRVGLQSGGEAQDLGFLKR